jgi:predicted  nucleic acid-binding Zn-ribbon protein
MNENAKRLLKLNGLVLLRKGLELPKPYVEEPGFEYLDEKIDRLRHQISGEILASYDRLSRQFPDPVTIVTDGVCQGCQQAISTPVAALAARWTRVPQCERCGRFILARR